MAVKCTICTHPERLKIDKALVEGSVSIRAIASKWHVGREALRRHVDNGHIKAKIAKVQAAHEAVEADDLLNEIREIEQETKDVIQSAKDDKKPYLVLKAIDTRHKQIELKGKVLGSFKGDKPNGPTSKAREMSDEEIERRARDILDKRK